MRIDRTHLPWLIASSAILAVCLVIYVLYALTAPQVGGGTAIGLLFGVIGFGFMLFAAALGIRKRYPIWRIGRAQHWMRGHIWLGTLALPIIFLHAGFHFGGWLTTLLMVLLLIVTISGLAGAYLQHTLPTRIMREVAYETIYDQIGRIQRGLVTEAEERAGGVAEQMAPGRGAGATVVLTYIGAVPEINTELDAFNAVFNDDIKPYLMDQQKHSPLRSRAYSGEFFRKVREMLPERARPTAIALEEICEEKRQLDRQRTLHAVLHTWLFIHIPLSIAVILLGFVHAFGALRY
jgi:hypothetical protein